MPNMNQNSRCLIAELYFLYLLQSSAGPRQHKPFNHFNSSKLPDPKLPDSRFKHNMLHPHTYLLLSGLVPFISARPFLATRQAGGIVGVATFNDYAHQSGGEVCSNAGITTIAGMVYYSI